MGSFEVGINVFFTMKLLRNYGGQEVECGSLNVTGLHQLIEEALGGLVKVGVALLEEVSLLGRALRSLLLKLPSV